MGLVDRVPCASAIHFDVNAHRQGRQIRVPGLASLPGYQTFTASLDAGGEDAKLVVYIV